MEWAWRAGPEGLNFSDFALVLDAQEVCVCVCVCVCRVSFSVRGDGMVGWGGVMCVYVCVCVGGGVMGRGGLNFSDFALVLDHPDANP